MLLFYARRKRSEQAYRDNPDVEWKMFSPHRLGLVGVAGSNSDTIRLYGEFGGVMVKPSSSISSDIMQLGIYGLFGICFAHGVLSVDALFNML